MQQMAEQRYDRIGVGYADRRRPDPRLAAHIQEALADVESIVNVGAGTGSYEPREVPLVAVEPSITMIRQRSKSAAPAVRARAEELPFADGAFDASLAALTIHHWSNWRAGLSEMLRVSRRRIVLFTWDPASENTWLNEYFPHLLDWDRLRFPSITTVQEILGETEVIPVRIPHDCTDGFMGAYWRRPAAYLDPGVRAAISSLSTDGSSVSLARLADDLSTGAWEQKHGQVLEHENLDLGYRLVIASMPSNKAAAAGNPAAGTSCGSEAPARRRFCW
jgi:SAM-dependent methyltransferase